MQTENGGKESGSSAKGVEKTVNKWWITQSISTPSQRTQEACGYFSIYQG